MNNYYEELGATPPRVAKIQVHFAPDLGTDADSGDDVLGLLEIITSDGVQPAGMTGPLPVVTGWMDPDQPHSRWQLVSARISTPVDAYNPVQNAPTNTTGTVKLRMWAPDGTPPEPTEFWTNFVGTKERL